MKKITLFALAAVLVAGFNSCGNRSVKLESDADSLSYALGVSVTNGLAVHLQNEMDVDSAYMGEFLRGVSEVMTTDSKARNAYAAGAQFALWAKKNLDQAEDYFFKDDSLSKIDRELYVKAFIAAMKEEDDLKMDMEEANEFLQNKQAAIRHAQLEEQFGAYRLEGIAFLEENKKQDGVVETESGLQYKVNTLGRGVKPTALDTVVVEYKGTLIDGTVFDQREEPTSLPLVHMIPAWQEGLPLMPVGSSFTFYVPYELGYGETGSRMIKPFSTLIFDVKLVSVKPYVAKTAEE